MKASKNYITRAFPVYYRMTAYILCLIGFLFLSVQKYFMYIHDKNKLDII